jgi:hypothetical protein
MHRLESILGEPSWKANFGTPLWKRYWRKGQRRWAPKHEAGPARALTAMAIASVAFAVGAAQWVRLAFPPTN